jgi:hypothetical protein
LWAHPAWRDALHDWENIRIFAAGRREVMRHAYKFIPKAKLASEEEYAAHVRRAEYLPATPRAIVGMTGALFASSPTLTGIPSRLDTASFGESAESIEEFAKLVGSEIVTLGRCMAYVDRTADGASAPYAVLALAENILDWKVERVNGRKIPTKIVIREWREEDQAGVSRVPVPSYRVLSLDAEEDGSRVYRQYIYSSDKGAPEISDDYLVDVITPTNRGRAFDHIPAQFFSADPSGNTLDISPSPIRDVQTLNVSHLNGSALLNSALYWVGCPVFAIEAATSSDVSQDIVLGPNTAVEYAPGTKTPQWVEFNGRGLDHLIAALKFGRRATFLTGTALAASPNQIRTSNTSVQSKRRKPRPRRRRLRPSAKQWTARNAPR